MGAPEPTHPFQTSADWHGESMTGNRNRELDEPQTTGAGIVAVIRGFVRDSHDRP